ncbi:hypothetical protein V1J52_19420 [Streptomyces sp. TRM 70351]|uniref:hypothetical protein n=1 Tax=Streptomyces sp. TRM 70351 TaxID=3116552 RepID=UPI002E7AFBC1|nr:hypothetical protein [Streptomyces sp. TRM 70351]MEE1930325.1 hypothetical protein [Streptomyces sp. TRM 70351]
MTLSAADCAALAPVAAAWLARGATAAQLTHALTAGLPPEVHCPGALARTRLTAKMPPEPVRRDAPAPVRRLVECTGCGRPGRPEALPGGLCRDCRGVRLPGGPGQAGDRTRRARTRAHADRVRAAVAGAGAGRRG